MARPASARHEWIIIPLLTAITLAAFWPDPNQRFIRHDDDAYIYENPHVSSGLTVANIGWAVTAVHAYNWHPLTWISHMVDAQIYGLDPAGHHWTNLLLHLANVILLFLLLGKITGSGWRCAFVAALFAVHPLHVEPVVWAAERKELLSAFFAFLTIWAYARYAERPGVRRYLPVLLFYAAALMSKPMPVTLPILLLFLDYWPLARLGTKGISLRQLVLEKSPLLLLAGASSVITLIAQQSTGAVMTLVGYPLRIRIENAIVTCVAYIKLMFWPVDLAMPYPYPGSGLPSWQVIGSAVVLALVTAAAVRFSAQRRYLLTGWSWYLVSLIPVIGLVQVGGQAMADRYTYIPMIGLFIVVAWGIGELLPKGQGKLKKQANKGVVPLAAIGSLACAAVIALAADARVQKGYWRDGITLFTHTLAVTRDNYLAHNHLGVAYDDAGNPERALEEYRKALRIAPDFAPLHFNLGRALVQTGRIDEAIGEYRIAIQLAPGDWRNYHNLGYALDKAGKFDEAMLAFREAVRLEPGSGESHSNLAIHLFSKEQYAEAWKEVHLAQQCGSRVHPEFLKALSARMREPSR